jgi:uncharacterized protein (DUF2384 family)
MTTGHQITKPAAKRSAPPAEAKPATTRIPEKTAVKMTLGTLTRSVKIRVFISWKKMGFADKIHLIRLGVPAQRVGELSSIIDMPKEAVMKSLGLSRATINRKVELQQMLSPQESERVMGMQTLIGQVQAMINTESSPNSMPRNGSQGGWPLRCLRWAAPPPRALWILWRDRNTSATC